MPLTESVVAKIREELDAQGVSQRELARRMNRPQSWVFRRLSESPEVQLNVGEIDEVAAALEVPVTRFLPAESPASSS